MLRVASAILCPPHSPQMPTHNNYEALYVMAEWGIAGQTEGKEVNTQAEFTCTGDLEIVEMKLGCLGVRRPRRSWN